VRVITGLLKAVVDGHSLKHYLAFVKGIKPFLAFDDSPSIDTVVI